MNKNSRTDSLPNTTKGLIGLYPGDIKAPAEAAPAPHRRTALRLTSRVPELSHPGTESFYS